MIGTGPVRKRRQFSKKKYPSFCNGGVGAALYDCLSCGWLLGLVGRRRHYEAHDDDGGGIGIGGEGSTVVVVDVSSGDDDNDHDDDVRRRFGVIDYLFMLCGCLVG